MGNKECPRAKLAGQSEFTNHQPPATNNHYIATRTCTGALSLTVTVEVFWTQPS
jgi:hypothetical protein